MTLATQRQVEATYVHARCRYTLLDGTRSLSAAGRAWTALRVRGRRAAREPVAELVASVSGGGAVSRTRCVLPCGRDRRGGHGPGDLQLDGATLVQPDLFVLPLIGGRRPVSPSDIGRALLVVEVLSPSTARHDRVMKRARYQRYGVEYWIVDLDARLVERWTPGVPRPEILTGTLTWQAGETAVALRTDLDALFAEALGKREPRWIDRRALR